MVDILSDTLKRNMHTSCSSMARTGRENSSERIFKGEFEAIAEQVVSKMLQYCKNKQRICRQKGYISVIKPTKTQRALDILPPPTRALHLSAWRTSIACLT